MSDSFFLLLGSIRTALFVGSTLMLVAALSALYLQARGVSRTIDIQHPEKRRRPRLVCEWSVDLYAPYRGVGGETKYYFKPAAGQVVNRSLSGVCLKTSIPYRLGELVEGWLASPEEGHLPLKGHVVWAKKNQSFNLVGVEFSAQTAASRLA